jgi:hypothetical protein
VKDEAGAPKTGIVGITFALYKDQQGGAPLWLETQNVQADASGRYTVMLGATKSDGLPMDFSAATRRAGWACSLRDRANSRAYCAGQRALSAPYALKASDAETLGGAVAMPTLPVEPSMIPEFSRIVLVFHFVKLA